jgi:HYR domain
MFLMRGDARRLRRRWLAAGTGAFATALLCVGTVAASSSAPPQIRITVPAPVEATNASGADATYHVKAYDSTTPIDATCDIPAGTTGSGDFDAPIYHYPLGNTPVTCTATTSGFAKSATITVQDTTAPAFPPLPDVSATTADPGGTNVSYAIPSATDAVTGTIPGTCTPASGTHFDVGSTLVTCTATDSSGNRGTATFNVNLTLIDNVPPTFTTVPSDITQEATGPGGAAVSYTIAATDNAGPPTVTCDHPSGSTFPLGTTTVTCTATDSAGNSTTAHFNVTIRDTTKPSFPPLADVNATTTDPSGTDVSYSVPTATDAVSGSIPGSCTPATGTHFAVGSTLVTCTATDSSGNTGTASFHVVVAFVDQTPPVLSGVPPSVQIEANGPSGSVSTYSTPTAVDAVDGPIATVTCAPASGSTFPLGATVVTCSATDSHGNTGTASFTITVVDTTAPHLIPPGDYSVYATTDSGISAGEGNAAAFLAGASASDVIDPHPTVTNDAPAFFAVGSTVVTFVARDASGNTTSAQATLTVLPMPPAGTTAPFLPPPADRQPPDDVTNLTATAGDHVVTLKWTKPTAADFAAVVVTRSLSTDTSLQVVRYRGTATTFADRTVENGREYRYVVTAVDNSGNSSRGVAVAARPKLAMLRSPKDGAKVALPPQLVWLGVVEASYYNVQLFRGRTKILSAWPQTTLKLQRSWKYVGRRYSLARGTYTWFVWPGYGKRADAKYGALLGSSTFIVIR